PPADPPSPHLYTLSLHDALPIFIRHLFIFFTALLVHEHLKRVVRLLRALHPRRKQAGQPFFGQVSRIFADELHLPFLDNPDARFNEIPYHTFNIAADIAPFSEPRRSHFCSRPCCPLCHPSRYFCFPLSCRSNHQNVFGNHFVFQLIIQLHPPASVPHCYRNFALRTVLTDDILIKTRCYLSWRKILFHL